MQSFEHTEEPRMILRCDADPIVGYGELELAIYFPDHDPDTGRRLAPVFEGIRDQVLK